MKHLLTFAALVAFAQTSFAQPAKPAYSYYEGFNVSMGLSQHTTKDVNNSTSIKNKVGVARLNYTFALPYPMKLGLTASFDLRNSPINSTENLAVSSPSEITVEPGILLLTNSLLYGKLGTFNTNYESGTGVSRRLNGTTYGVGIKHYVYGQNFIQAEWAHRNVESNNAGAIGKFKQSTADIQLGFNY